MKKLYLLFLTLLCALPGLAQNVYLVPDGETSVQEQYKFTSDGTTYTLNVSGELSGSFQIWYNPSGTTYAKMGSNSTIELGASTSISGGTSGTSKCNVGTTPITNAVITVSGITKKGSNYSATMTVTGTRALPNVMYMIGSIEGNSDWNESTAQALTLITNGVYEATNITLIPDDGVNAAFQFVSSQNPDEAVYYGANGSSALEVFKASGIMEDGDNFSIAPGTYTIRLNLNNNTVLVEPVINSMNIVGTLGVNGTIAADQNISMTKDANGNFTAQNVIIAGVGAGNGSFYFSENFSNGEASGLHFGPANRNDRTVQPGVAKSLLLSSTFEYSIAPGIYNITMNVEAMQVTLTPVADAAIVTMTANGSNYFNANPGDVKNFIVRVGDNLYGCTATTQLAGMPLELTKLGADINYISMTQNGAAASMADRALYYRNGRLVAVTKNLLISGKTSTRTMSFEDDGTFRGTVPYFNEMILGSEADGVVYGNPVSVSAGVYTLTPSVYGESSWITNMTPFQNKIVVFNPYTMSLTIQGDGDEKPTISTLSMVGTLGINGDLTTTSPNNGIELTAGENGVFTAENVIISGTGNFFFVEKTGADWDQVGFQYGPATNNRAITAGTPQALTMTTSHNAYAAPQGIYNVSVNMETMQVTLTTADGAILEMTATGANYINTNPGNVQKFIVRLGNEFYGCKDAQPVGMQFALTKLGANIDYITMTDGDVAASLADRVLYLRNSNKMFVAVPKVMKIMNNGAESRTMEFTDNYTFTGTVPYFNEMIIGADKSGVVYGNPITAGTNAYTLTPSVFNSESWITDMTPFQNKIVEFSPFTMALTITGNGNEKPTINTLSMVGTLGINGDLTTLSSSKGITLTKDENGVFTAENVIISGAGNFFFVENTGADWDHVGFQYGPATNNRAITAGTPQALTMTTSHNAYAAPQGIYNVAVDMEKMTVTLTAADGTILEMTANGANYINTNPGDVKNFIVRMGNEFYGYKGTVQVGMPFTMTKLGETIDYINMNASLADQVLYLRTSNKMFVAVPKVMKIMNNGDASRTMEFTDNFTFKGTVPYFNEMIIGADKSGVVYGNPVTVSGGVYTLTPSVFGENSWITNMTPFQNKIVEFNPYTMTLTIQGDGDERPTISTLSMVGTLGINGDLTTLSPSKGISLTQGENGIFTAENVIISGAGNFFFVEKTGENWGQVGFQYGPQYNGTAVTPGEAQTMTMTSAQPTFTVTPGIYNVSVDMENMTVTLTKTDGTIVELTSLGANYVNNNPGNVGDFIVRVGNEFYSYNEPVQIGMPATLTKLGATISYIELKQGETAANTEGRRFFFDPATKTFIAVPTQLTMAGNGKSVNMTYNAINGTYTGTIPYWSSVIIGNIATDNATYGAPATAGANNVYALTANTENNPITNNIAAFQNKIVEFNPLAMTLAITGNGNEKPEISTLNIVGSLAVNGVFANNGVAMTKGEGNVFTAENVIIGGVSASGNGTFSFAEAYDNGTPSGFQFGAERNNTPITAGFPQNLTMNAYTFSAPQGIYNVTVDMDANEVVLTAVDGTIVDMTTIPGSDNYVYNPSDDLTNFVVRVGSDLYTTGAPAQIGMPITMVKVSSTLNYVQLMKGTDAATLEGRRFFFAPATKTFIAAPTALKLEGNDGKEVEMTYSAATGTYTATVPYWTSMVIGNVDTDNAVYGAPATASETNVYKLTASTTANPITNMVPFHNKVVAFNPLAMTLTITGTGNEKPEVSTLFFTNTSTNAVTELHETTAGVFSNNVTLTKNNYFRLTDKSGNDYMIAIIPAAGGSLALNVAVSVDYTSDKSVVTSKRFQFVGDNGTYKLTVDLNTMQAQITSFSDVETFAALQADNGGFFVGTATCEFNYENDENTYNLWLVDAAGTALEFTINPTTVTGEGVEYMGPTHFNRGNTITRFRAAEQNGVFVITEFETHDVQQGNKVVQTPWIGEAKNTEIKVETSISENMLNKMVQVKGNVYTNSTEKYIVVGDTQIPIFSTFTKPVDPFGAEAAPRRAESDNISWQYGNGEMPSLSGDELYVAGIVSKDESGNLGINVTSISNNPTTGVDSVELDAETIVDVYNMQGMLVRRAIKYGEAMQELPSGIYIIAGKKVMIRR